MNRFGKHLAVCFGWLLLSEILCLILGISIAILRNPVIVRGSGILFGAAAHILLIGNAAQKTADEDAAFYRTSGTRTKTVKPLLIAFCSMLPACVTYLLLRLNPESTLMLNLFPLLNAQFIQIHRLLIGGAEPFSAVAPLRGWLMALPPLLTAAAWLFGYELRYQRSCAAFDAKRNRT